MSDPRRGLTAEEPHRRSAAAALVRGDGAADATNARSGQAKPGARGRRTRRLSIDLDAELVEELRDAVVYLQRSGVPETTLAGLVAASIGEALQQLRTERGLERFPSRGPHQPKPGRRPTQP